MGGQGEGGKGDRVNPIPPECLTRLDPQGVDGFGLILAYSDLFWELEPF